MDDLMQQLRDYWASLGLPPASNPKEGAGRLKPRLSDMPTNILFEVGKVNALGADKYGRFNWAESSISASTYYDAILRHLHQWWFGEDTDTESGCHHLAHIIAGAMLLRDGMNRDRFIDDRPPALPDGWLTQEKTDGSQEDDQEDHSRD